MKVIIADDELKVAKLIKALIDWDALGMELCGIARNGNEALDLIREHRPDVVITDIRMPGLGGIELIERSKELAPSLEFVIISGYRHFNYAHSAMKYGVVDYLLKPIDKDELRMTLEKLKEKITARESAVSERDQISRIAESERRRRRAGLYGFLMDPSNRPLITVDYLNENFGYAFSADTFRYVVFKVDGGYDEVYSESLALFGEKLRGICDRQLGGLCAELEIEFIYSGANIVLNYDAGRNDEVRGALKDVFDEVRVQNNYFPSGVFTMLAGAASGDAAGLADSWHNAEWMMYERLIIGAGSYYEDLPEKPGSEKVAALSRSVAKAIEQAMDVMDADALRSVISDASAQLLAVDRLTGRDVRDFAKSVHDTWLTFALQYNVTYPGGERLRDEFLRHFDLMPTARAALDFLVHRISEAFGELREAIGDANGRPVTNAKLYIKEHFAEPIAIDDIAEAQGFNSSYFSTLFKKETGSTFSEYLRGVRMDEAKRLLKETNSSVAVICELVGYNDTKHFSSSFRKATGVKPSEYRKLYAWER
ncbi:MAG: response regulator [Clostridiales Family XIII bacterium]|jgi:two-component system response regulator YesN|nr:response regulator [Clostridiales Family XIII bacterium]